MSKHSLDVIRQEIPPGHMAEMARIVQVSFKGEIDSRQRWRERMDICVDGYLQLRKDQGWHFRMVLDHLPTYLRCKIDGAPWEPMKGEAYSPERLLIQPPAVQAHTDQTAAAQAAAERTP